MSCTCPAGIFDKNRPMSEKAVKLVGEIGRQVGGAKKLMFFLLADQDGKGAWPKSVTQAALRGQITSWNDKVRNCKEHAAEAMTNDQIDKYVANHGR
jgi:hypothetical protein